MSDQCKETRDKHTAVCTKYPVQCPNKCQIGSLERGQLQQHIRECPLQVVDCELKELGCNMKLPRRDISKHMEESTGIHFELMTIHTLKMNQQVRILQQQQAAMLKSLTKTQEDLTNFEKKFMEMLTDTEKLLTEKERDILVLNECVKEITTQFPNVEFTLAEYTTYRSQHKKCKGCPDFYTFPARYRMTINLNFSRS